MKKYEFVFDSGKDEVIRRLFMDVKKPELFGEDKIYGRLSKNKHYFSLYHGITRANSFKPIFSGKIIEENSKTVITGRWRFSIYIMLFSFVWLGTLFFISLLPLIHGNLKLSEAVVLYPVVLIFAGFFVLMVVFSVYIERKNMDKIIRHIEIQQSIINKN